jgi:hypothetical protein
VLGGDPRSLVLDLDPHAALAPERVHLHLPSGVAVADGVDEQISQGELDPVRVGGDGLGRGIDFRRDRHSRLLGLAPHRVHRLADGPVRGERAGM